MPRYLTSSKTRSATETDPGSPLVLVLPPGPVLFEDFENLCISCELVEVVRLCLLEPGLKSEHRKTGMIQEETNGELKDRTVPSMRGESKTWRLARVDGLSDLEVSLVHLPVLSLARKVESFCRVPDIPVTGTIDSDGDEESLPVLSPSQLLLLLSRCHCSRTEYQGRHPSRTLHGGTEWHRNVGVVVLNCGYGSRGG
eukprot:768588-Hanusia_phi.AAC.1